LLPVTDAIIRKSILPFKIPEHQKTFLFGELCFAWAFSLNQLGEITLVKVRADRLIGTYVAFSEKKYTAKGSRIAQHISPSRNPPFALQSANERELPRTQPHATTYHAPPPLGLQMDSSAVAKATWELENNVVELEPSDAMFRQGCSAVPFTLLWNATPVDDGQCGPRSSQYGPCNQSDTTRE
jgi:hypothetical protein